MPAVEKVGVRIAVSPVKLAIPMEAPPTSNVTDPVGVGPAEAGLTVAVSMSVPPKAMLGEEMTSDVVVALGGTVIVPVAVSVDAMLVKKTLLLGFDKVIVNVSAESA